MWPFYDDHFRREVFRRVFPFKLFSLPLDGDEFSSVSFYYRATVKPFPSPPEKISLVFTYDSHIYSNVQWSVMLEILRPRLYREKLSRIEGSLAYPSYPGRANFSYISLQNLANHLHEKQKVGSAGRVTRLAGSSFFDGRVTLLAGPTFLHINTLARLAGSTPPRRHNQIMRERCWLWQRGQLFSII